MDTHVDRSYCTSYDWELSYAWELNCDWELSFVLFITRTLLYKIINILMMNNGQTGE